MSIPRFSKLIQKTRSRLLLKLRGALRREEIAVTKLVAAYKAAGLLETGTKQAA